VLPFSISNGDEFNGESLFQLGNNSAATPLPLVYPGADGSNANHDCSMVRGAEVGDKVMLCENRGLNGRTEAGQTMEAYGGVGMIVVLTVGDNDEVKEKTMNPPATST
jgi:hypothetical protein